MTGRVKERQETDTLFSFINCFVCVSYSQAMREQADEESGTFGGAAMVPMDETNRA